ncbi:MAG: radical SAM protein [Gammaproteobacteria bacterium]|nr:radical SAM protein [Gammaproteobacteria bacterium]
MDHNHECMVEDLNLKFYRHILTPKLLISVEKELRESFAGFDSKDELKNREAILYSRQASALARIPYIIEHIEEAVSIFSEDKRFFNLRQLVWGLKIVEEALECYSSSLGFSELGISQFRTKYSTADPQAIWDSTFDKIENPFVDLLSTWVSGIIQSYQPDVIGLSIMLDEQLIPGVTLARQIREDWSGRLVVGGSMITRLKESIEDSPHIGELFDKFFFYESENDFASWLDQESCINKSIDYPDFSEITPNFDDYSLENYFLPYPVLTYQGTRGCSFGMCRYCSHYKTYGVYDSGCPERAANVLDELSRKYGTKYFYLLDESLDPPYAKRFASELSRKAIDIRYMVFARSSRRWTKDLVQKIAQTGCRRLIIGIDGLSEKIQSLMNKHTDLNHAEKILNWCREFNIAVQVNVIVGFPGELLNDCMGSLKFLEKNKTSLTTLGSSFAFTPFYLIKEAAWDEMSMAPETRNVPEFTLCFSYEVTEGISMNDSLPLTLELMQKADKILESSKRAPLIREFAFLYNDYYQGIEDFPPSEFSVPVPSSSGLWARYDIPSLIKEINIKMLELDARPNDYISRSWRVSQEKSIVTEFSGEINHKILCWSSANTVEMPIVKHMSLTQKSSQGKEGLASDHIKF